MEIVRAKTKFLMGIDSPTQLEEWLTANHPMGIAFVGRSNVGKSSLINSLFGNNTARTSKTPGRTRQINVFEFTVQVGEEKDEQTFFLFDLPGYGHAEISKEMAKNWKNLMNVFFQNSHNLLLVNIQDSRHPVSDADIQFSKYFETIDARAFVVFNKIDKLKTQSERARLKNLQKSLMKEMKWARQVHYVSAEKKTGIPALEQGFITELLGLKIKM